MLYSGLIKNKGFGALRKSAQRRLCSLLLQVHILFTDHGIFCIFQIRPADTIRRGDHHVKTKCVFYGIRIGRQASGEKNQEISE